MNGETPLPSRVMFVFLRAFRRCGVVFCLARGHEFPSRAVWVCLCVNVCATTRRERVRERRSSVKRGPRCTITWVWAAWRRPFRRWCEVWNFSSKKKKATCRETWGEPTARLHSCNHVNKTLTNTHNVTLHNSRHFTLHYRPSRETLNKRSTHMNSATTEKKPAKWEVVGWLRS